MIYQLSFALCIFGYLTRTDAAGASGMNHYSFSRNEPSSTPPQFSLADSISTFSINLVEALNGPLDGTNENVVCSPISVYNALALLLLGSSGSTTTDLRKAMKIPSGYNSVHGEIGKLRQILQEENLRIGNRSVSQVTFADAIFVDERLTINQVYENYMNHFYKSNIQKLDFADGYKVMELINNWISTKTNNQIPKIFTEPVDHQSSIVEVTSVYFSGGWSERFPFQGTKKENFQTATGSVEVDMMSNKGRIPHYSSQQFDAIQLDFHGRHYVGIFILPKEGRSVSNLIKNLDRSTLQLLSNKDNYKGVNYKLPKMKFFSSRSLKEPLSSREISLSKLFDKANLGNMLDAHAHKISDVNHAVEIEVDELGAKATALTSVRIEPLAAKNPPESAIDFFLNRPFIFIIQHRATETVLFTAVIRQPQ